MDINDFIESCLKALFVFVLVWAFIYIPTCSWHNYQDDLTCKKQTGLYNCDLKNRDINLNIRNKK